MSTTTGSAAHLPAIGAHQREEIGLEPQATLLELIDLSLLGKQLHWSVVGPLFRPLHKLIDSWRDLADTVAGRAVAIGSWPDGQADANATGSAVEGFGRGAIEDRSVLRELAKRLAEVVERTRGHMNRLAKLESASEDVLVEVVREPSSCG